MLDGGQEISCTGGRNKREDSKPVASFEEQNSTEAGLFSGENETVAGLEGLCPDLGTSARLLQQNLPLHAQLHITGTACLELSLAS